MRGIAMARLGILLTLGVGLLAASQAVPQVLQKDRRVPAPAPRLEPVAETRLLMEGLNQANFHGLERILKQKPGDAEAWAFARGQALLIAETGNLLLMRPPRQRGREAWLERAVGLREAATALARAAGNREYPRSRALLGELAQACNRCHQTFRVATRIQPFAQAGDDTLQREDPRPTMPR
jgi:hypothetical protein